VADHVHYSLQDMLFISKLHWSVFWHVISLL